MSVIAAFVHMLARVSCMVGWMGISGVGIGIGLLYIYRMEVLKDHDNYRRSLDLQFMHDATSA